MPGIERELLSLINSGYVLLELATFEEERAVELLSRLAEQEKAGFSVWSVMRGFGDQATAPALPGEALARIAATEGRVFFALLDFHPYLSEPVVVRQFRELQDLLLVRGQALIVVTPCPVIPPELEKDLQVLELPLPMPQELGRILEAALIQLGVPDLGPEVKEGMVRASLGLTARQARRVFTRALRERPAFTLSDLPLVLEQKKEILRRTRLLEFFEVSESLEHIGGLDQLKQWLLTRASAFSESARQYGLPEPRGLLLLGAQGCGKSLCAKAVSNLWQMPLLRFDAGMVLGSFQATAEENMRRCLQLAESLAPCVLWIDEIEKGFSSQQVSGGQESGRVARAFASFLVWLQEKTRPVYVIATANSIAELPPELVRKGRFDEIFFVDLPHLHERREIFAIHLRKRGRDPAAFDVAGLAKQSEGFSGSEIEQCLISAMYEAFTAGREVTTEDIRRALAETVPLSETLKEKVQELRDWAKNRARPASLDTKLLDLFREGQQSR